MASSPNAPSTVQRPHVVNLGCETAIRDNKGMDLLDFSAAGFTFAGAEVGATYDYTVTSSGGGTPVTESGVISSATQQVTGIDVSSLPDGILTYSVVLTDSLGNAGAAATATAALDKTAPTATIAPNGTTVNSSPITFTITFNEPVTGMGVEDLSAIGVFPIPLTLANFHAVSATVYTVDVSGMSPGGDVVYFALASVLGISDTAGNTLATGAMAIVTFQP